MNIRTRVRPFWLITVLLAMLAASCSGSATTTISETAETADTAQEAGDTQEEPTAVDEPTPEPTAVTEPTAEPLEPTQAPEPTAEPLEPTQAPEPDQVFFASELQVGDCFIRVPGEFQQPEVVPCTDLHEEELYAITTLDDAAGTPYPGEDELFDRVATELCDSATIDFLGASWDLLPVTTLVLYPLEVEWDAGDRNVACTAASSETDMLKIGTAAGGTITTDDVLVARAAITNNGVQFDDWVLITQHADLTSIGSLTDGQFELPLRRPFPIEFGLMFHARDAGDDGHATTTWGYNWANQEFTDLGSILPGQELSSLVVADGVIIFAARAEPNDDWDLWSTVSGDAAVIAGGPGDQRFPTLTPDGSKVVYQDNGDIWIASLDGSDPEQLTSSPANDWESIVSPDGSTVVFSSDRTGNDDLWAVPITGGEPVNLTNHPGADVWPVFSEDGSLIYFASDRLVPEGDRSVVMVMNTDGSNQSWFAGSQSSQPIVVPSAVAADVLSAAPTLNERYNYELVEGEPATTTTWSHSSGRLTVDLPAGWRVGEVNEGIGFVAGPRPDQYFEFWAVDGVLVVLWDGETEETFFDIVAGAREFVAGDCEQFDGTDGIVPIAEGIIGLSANYNCPDDSVAGVLSFYNQTTGVGVILEGQRDNLPDFDTDADMLTALAISLVWG